jgi:hypothetical protein
MKKMATCNEKSSWPFNAVVVDLSESGGMIQ